MSGKFDHLFVYGTLMSTARAAYGRVERVRLARECANLGAATVPGRLFDLGRYPGCIGDAPSGHLVHGEVVRLLEPDESLRWLDAYEGLQPDGGAGDEYVRERCVATLADGLRRDVWIYLYRGATTGLREITGGRWLESIS